MESGAAATSAIRRVLPPSARKTQGPVEGPCVFLAEREGLTPRCARRPCGAPAASKPASPVCRTGFCILPSLGKKKTRPRKGASCFSGGERGIRTLEGLLTLTPLAGERFRPLSHLSRNQIVFESRARSALTRAIPGARPPGGGAVQIGYPADLSTTQPSLQKSNCIRVSRKERFDSRHVAKKMWDTTGIRPGAHTT